MAQFPEIEPAIGPVLGLFLLTIVITVVVHSVLKLPSAMGMMAGLGLLKGFSYFYNRRHARTDVVGACVLIGSALLRVFLDDRLVGGQGFVPEPVEVGA